MKLTITFFLLLFFVNTESFAAQKSLTLLPYEKYCTDPYSIMHFMENETGNCFLVFNANKSRITVKIKNKISHLDKRSKGVYQSKNEKIKISFKSKKVKPEDYADNGGKDCAGENYCDAELYEGKLLLETPSGKENYLINYYRGPKSN